MAAYHGEPHGDQSSENQRGRDVLLPQQSLPSLEYVEYNRDFSGPPDYEFEIREMYDLMSGETELLGQPFRIRNAGYEARIQCRVSFSDVRLSLAVLGPSSEKPIEIHTQMVAIIRQSKATDNIVLTCDVKKKRFFNRFYPFCNFVYAERIRNPRSVLTVDLYAENKREELLTQVFRWKVDCSNMDITDDLGVSPIFYPYPRGFQAHIRLFIRGERVAAEFRFVNFIEIEERNSCISKFSITLIFMNPSDQRRNIVHFFNVDEWFEAEEWKAIELWMEFSTIREIADVKEVFPSFLINNKLMVKVKLAEIKADT